MTHPAAPTPPPPTGPTGIEFIDRPTFVDFLTAGVGAVAAGVLGLPLAGYVLGILRKRPDEWVALGPIDQFPAGETRIAYFPNPIRQPWDGMAANTAAYVRYVGKDDKGGHQFLVFAVNCTHLGCPVTWFPQSGLFMCPCHGGVYYEDGERASGPPPRGLYKYPWRVSKDGKLEVRAPHLPTLQDPLDDKDKADGKVARAGRPCGCGGKTYA